MPSNEEVSVYSSQVKSTLKITWRYFFSIVVLLFSAYVFVNERFINIENFVTLFTSAFIIDWVKMKFKMTANPDYKPGSFLNEHRFTNTIEPWNPHQPGTTAYYVNQFRKD